MFKLEPINVHDTKNPAGFEKSGEFKEIQTIKAQTTLSPELSKNLHNYHSNYFDSVKVELAKELMTEALKSDCINFQISKGLYEDQIQATMRIVPLGNSDTTAYIDRDVFVINTRKFSIKEVEEAVKHFYPEYFI